MGTLTFQLVCVGENHVTNGVCLISLFYHKCFGKLVNHVVLTQLLVSLALVHLVSEEEGGGGRMRGGREGGGGGEGREEEGEGG